MPSKPLFVYGTLLAVADHPMGRRLAAQGRKRGEGSIQARLYIIDDPDAPGENFYPGAVPSANPTDRVFGEVHDILDPAIYATFNQFEACAPGCTEPYEFLRRPVFVDMLDGTRLEARAYLYTWDVTSARRIVTGRYTDRAPDVR